MNEKQKKPDQFIDGKRSYTIMADSKLVPVEVGVNDAINVIPFRCASSVQVVLTDPVLTVPDLEDSVSQMLARRVAGLSTSTTSQGERVYPTDPSTLQTAIKVVGEYKETAEARLKAQQDAITQKELEAAKRIAQEKKEREAFEAFKASQPTPDKK